MTITLSGLIFFVNLEPPREIDTTIENTLYTGTTN